MKKFSYLISSKNNNNQALCLTRKQANEYKKTFEKTDLELQKVYHWATLPTYKIEKVKRIIDLESSKILHVIELNQKLNNELYEDYMQMLGEQQEEAARATLGEDWIDWISCKNNYSSFYFILKDYKEFLVNLDPDCLDEKEKNIYNTLINRLDVLDTLNEDQFYNLDAWLEEKSKKLLELIENDLHEYEETPSESEIIEYAEQTDCLDDLFIKIHEDGTSDNVIRDLAGRCYM